MKMLSSRKRRCTLVMLALALALALAVAPAAAQGAPVAEGGLGRAWLSVSAFTRARNHAAREVGGVLALAFAFDRVVRPAASSTPARGWSEDAAPVATVPAARRPVRLSPLLARACVRAAWHVSGLGESDARIDAIVSRARWAALLPEARMRAIRYDDDRYYTDVREGDAARARDTASSNLGLEARLTWRLDRLVYAHDEPSLERIRSERRDARTRIARRALEALFRWHRARIELGAAAPGSPEELEATLRLYEAEAVLDVLTGGWFGAHRPVTQADTPRAAPP